MLGEAYLERRGEIQTYFDRTAVESWKRFATQAPLGRIRASVREGRARMRATMLAMLPQDLSGWRVLDAGCGTGAMSAELARRGALVLDGESFARCRQTSILERCASRPATCWRAGMAPSMRWSPWIR